jgi:hypothetical protein
VRGECLSGVGENPKRPLGIKTPKVQVEIEALQKRTSQNLLRTNRIPDDYKCRHTHQHQQECGVDAAPVNTVTRVRPTAFKE